MGYRHAASCSINNSKYSLIFAVDPASLPLYIEHRENVFPATITMKYANG